MIEELLGSFLGRAEEAVMVDAPGGRQHHGATPKEVRGRAAPAEEDNAVVEVDA